MKLLLGLLALAVVSTAAFAKESVHTQDESEAGVLYSGDVETQQGKATETESVEPAVKQTPVPSEEKPNLSERKSKQ